MSFWKKFFGDAPENHPSSEEQSLEEHFDSAGLEDSDNQLVPDRNTSESNETSDEEESTPTHVGDIDQQNSSNLDNEDEDLTQSQNEELAEAHSTSDQSDREIPSTSGEQQDEETHAADSTTDESDEEEVDPEVLLQKELEAAQSAALVAQLEIETQEYLEDLSNFDGRVLPQLKVPDWREELEFVKERYEPCDLSDHIVKVSKRRLTARQIDHELALSRLNAYERYLERASRRFKDKIDEDAVLNDALTDLSQWRSEQGKSVAWLLAERINEEALKAERAKDEATSFVENNVEFTNPQAIEVYRHFARRLFIIPLTTIYVMSVVSLTYSRFEWIMKFFPFFNLGLAKVLYMIGGIASYFLIANFWRYSKHVTKIQRQLVEFNKKYQEQEKKIRHAVSEHTRLTQQQPLVEPILHVLAKAYRVQLQSDEMAKIHATTDFESASLPACVTVARAVDSEEDKMARLKRRALNVLMTPGWRTNGLNEIARIYADSRMLDAHSLSLSSLDTDSMISASSAQRLLLDAFSDLSIHGRVSKARLVRAIREIHKEVLANWSSDDRPNVMSLRNDGFDKISFRTSWLADEDGTESWIPFLSEVLTQETAPFSQFNILDKRSEINMPDRISSVAVVPHYFAITNSHLKIEKSKSTEIMPLDVVVRVDVSPWTEPNAFAVFADDFSSRNAKATIESDVDSPKIGGFTGA